MIKVLVVLDPEEETHYGLQRVRELSADAVEIKVGYFYQPKPVSAASASETQVSLEDKRTRLVNWLNELVQPYKAEGYKIETEIVIFKRLYKSIIKSAEDWQADVIFKPLRHHGSLERVFYTSTDWNLTRYSAYPILFVGSETSVRSKPVLAAINTASSDKHHRNLNESVIEQAKFLSSFRVNEDQINTKSATHIVNAYNLVVVPASLATPDPQAYQMTQNGRVQIVEKCRAFARQHDLDEDKVHILEGAADEVIHRIADEIDAGIIVLGTVARSGLSGLFIGNTAESVMEASHRDIFVIKAKEFQSALK